MSAGYTALRIAIFVTIVCAAITFASFKGQENRPKSSQPPKSEEEKKEGSQPHSQ